ncbi:histidine kinase dimerization/phosphoacceptor domain -containing protein [Beijerinckia sp. L45]|uniref:histidine kinase dimerization/phosphoacceptor domain -containing protein n=1 Tax=Beijerinckia sp. L45 TaxID=1641855 RepID=UPI00131B6264|nr:histidine kinase dimerization/phosphoacceptor domain -containing protein [Beijerinckia sp. L45]
MTDVHDWHETDRLHAEQGQGDPFAAAVRATRMAMIITDPRLPDNPIVYANAAFLGLTGYSRAEVMGRNCRFLQGPDTDRDAVTAIRVAIAGRVDIAVDLLNYRKDGSTFWNGLYLSPVINASGELQFFFASQLDVTDRVMAQMQVSIQKDLLEREVTRRTQDLQDALAAKTMLVHEVDHRVKNNLQMIASLLVMQARTIKDPEAQASLRGMLQRVESIGTIHRRLYQSSDVQQFDLADFIRDIAGELIKASGRDDIALALDLEPINVRSEQASPVALMLNELITNALKHAFPFGRAGQLAIEIRRAQDILNVVVADNGVGMAPGQAEPAKAGFGRRLIKTVARQLRAEVTWLSNDPGTRVDIAMPLQLLAEETSHA